MAGIAWAQPPLRAAGEFASATQTTLNGTSAISGMTVFSNNRIRTDSQGAAIINLGRLGRIEFGAETDMTLRFSAESIGGELHYGRLVISSRAGVTIAVNTAKGICTTDGREPSVLTIHAASKNARIIVHRGEAYLTLGSKVERIVAGQVPRPVIATNSLPKSILTDLFKAGINYSIDRVFNGYRDPAQSLKTTITCREQDNFFCRRWGAVTP